MTDLQGRKPPADPSGIELRYSHEHRWDDHGGDGPEKWWVSADVPDAEDMDGQPATSHVGSMEIVFVDPYDPSAFDLLDGYDADLSPIGTVLELSNMQSHGWHPDLLDQLEFVGGQLLILNRVQLAPEWRGFGIGVLLAGLAIKRLSRGCQAAACYPGSFEGERDKAKLEAAAAKLGEVWTQLGFTHFQDGVYVLDLASTTLDDAIEHLRQRLSRYY